MTLTMDTETLNNSACFRTINERGQVHSSHHYDTCIHDLFAAQAELTPGALAVVCPTTNLSLTYQELHQRSNQLARYLIDLGVGSGSIVGIFLDRSIDMVVGLLGILKAGAAYLPLEPSYPSARIAFMLNDAAVAIILTQSHLVSVLPEVPTHLVSLDLDWPDIATHDVSNLNISVLGTDLIYVLYTSGSTGLPKGVMCTHAGIFNQVQWIQSTIPLTPSDRILQKTPFSFDVSVLDIFWPLVSGACVILASPGGHQDPPYLLSIIQQQQISVIHFVPTMLDAFLDQHGLAQARSLRIVICAGEALSFNLQQRFFDALDCELYNLYGPTEASVTITCWACQRNNSMAIVPIGKPIANSQVYVLDPSLQLMPVGVPGELYIAGVCLARGYLNRPDLTSDRFIANPFSAIPGDRMYKSGDLARWLPDGNLEFLGRFDGQVKFHGNRVELGEIEITLMLHPAVRTAVVIVREDTPGDQRLVAYIISESALSVDPDDLQRHLRKTLPSYMLPSHFVFLDALPLTSSGKVDRRALPAPFALPSVTRDEFVEPRNSTEERLALIWAKVLHIDADQISMTDNFFALGGHSLLAMQIFSRIESTFAKHLSVAVLLKCPTISQLAETIQADGLADEWSTIVIIESGNVSPKGKTLHPFFCVHGFGGGVLGYASLASHLGKFQPFIGLQAAGLDGKLAPDTDIDQMATRYIKAIRSVQPHGPYYLGGYCYGAYVAYEMACQLETQGEQVALVAIIEGYAPDNTQSNSSLSHRRRLANIWHNVPFWYREYLQLGLGGIQGRIRIKARSVAKTTLRHMGVPMQPDIQDFINHDPAQIPQTQREIIETHIRALSSYIPKPYSGCITLFRAEHQTISQAVFGNDDPELGWGGLVSGGVDVRICKGSHSNLHMEPYVASLAEHLKEALENCQSEAQRLAC